MSFQMHLGVAILFDLTHCITILGLHGEFGFFLGGGHFKTAYVILKTLYFYLDFLQEYFNGVFKAKIVCMQ